MSIATLEVSAPVQSDDEILAQLEKEEAAQHAAQVKPEADTATKPEAPAVDISTDERFLYHRNRIKLMADRERRLAQRNRLHIARECAEGIAEMVEAYATSHDMRASIRSNAAKVLALDLSAGYGTKFDDKEVYRFVRAHHLAQLVEEKTRKALDRLSWDATRTLTRWVREHEEDYSLAFRVDVGVKDDGGSTLRTVDATDLMTNLIGALVASPKSAGTIRKLMDEKEAEARKAELSYLTQKDQKRAAASMAMADRIEARKARTQMFDSFALKISKMGMTPEEVTAELYRAEILQGATAEFDPSMIVDIGAEDATAIGKLLIQAKNLDAISALIATFSPLLESVANDTQPSKAVGVTLGSVSRQVA